MGIRLSCCRIHVGKNFAARNVILGLGWMFNNNSKEEEG